MFYLFLSIYRIPMYIYHGRSLRAGDEGGGYPVACPLSPSFFSSLSLSCLHPIHIFLFTRFFVSLSFSHLFTSIHVLFLLLSLLSICSSFSPTPIHLPPPFPSPTYTSSPSRTLPSLPPYPFLHAFAPPIPSLSFKGGVA